MGVMNRIIAHHNGGTYKPNSIDRRSYPLMIDNEGGEHRGFWPIEANAPGKITKGQYYANTRGLNTGTIGIAALGMHGATWSNPNATKYPITARQVEGLIQCIARTAKQYRIEVTRQTVLTHAEVEITLGVWQRNKWDFDYDLWGGKGRDPVAIGDRLRYKVLEAMGGPVTAPKSRRSVIRWGSRGPAVKLAQAALGLIDDGLFGPKTARAVRTFQRKNDLLPDGVVGRMTWAALIP